ncbi:MAG TPA: TIGR01841 family phasin [Burkholderiales bacterium]|nr:TIGR01841 family phasin [Burkholderiales bacterium]
MYQAPEQFAALNKANLEVAMKFAAIAFEGTERLLNLQMKAVRSAVAESAETAKSIAGIKDLHQLASLQDDFAQPAIQKATAYAKGVYDVATATQAEFGKVVDAQVAEYNKQVVAILDRMVKTAPAGSELGIAALKSGIAAINSAYDNVSKVSRQFVDATQSNIETVVKQTANTVKKAKKSA